PACVPRRRRDRRVRRARPVEGQALPAGIPVHPAALVGGVPVRAARGGDRRRAARRCRDLGHPPRLRALRPAAVQRVIAPAAGVPGGLGRHHAGPRGSGRGADGSGGPAAPACRERSADGARQLPAARSRARRGDPAVVPHRSAVRGRAHGPGRPQEVQRTPRTAPCTTPRHAAAPGLKNPLVDPRPGAPVASGAMTSTSRTPGALTVGPLRPVILNLAAPAVAMMACHFCFNLIDAIWVGRLIGPAALAAVSTAGFYAWVVLSVGLDPLLISGVGPFPRLGVEGAALASVMVRGGGFLIGIGLAWRRGLLRLDAPDWRAVPTVFRVGAPLSLAGVLLSIVYMWLTRYTSRFGTAALAALGVGHKVEGLGFIAISGFALSASALVGQ